MLLYFNVELVWALIDGKIGICIANQKRELAQCDGSGTQTAL